MLGDVIEGVGEMIAAVDAAKPGPPNPGTRMSDRAAATAPPGADERVGLRAAASDQRRGNSAAGLHRAPWSHPSPNLPDARHRRPAASRWQPAAAAGWPRRRA